MVVEWDPTAGSKTSGICTVKWKPTGPTAISHLPVLKIPCPGNKEGPHMPTRPVSYFRGCLANALRTILQPPGREKPDGVGWHYSVSRRLRRIPSDATERGAYRDACVGRPFTGPTATAANTCSPRLLEVGIFTLNGNQPLHSPRWYGCPAGRTARAHSASGAALDLERGSDRDLGRLSVLDGLRVLRLLGGAQLRRLRHRLVERRDAVRPRPSTERRRKRRSRRTANQVRSARARRGTHVTAG